MGQVLYRKYRSRSLDEVVGQSHITETLKRALDSGSIAHAYLFTGPRGVGKTSVARILAYAVNQIQYTDDTDHLDIIEIDAASNRRIDEIRDLREKVHIAPAMAKYKVYLIDEVHMLTNEAFNALLKTLEEPPAHVIFILATTESHKVPETIVSRTQRFNFRPVEAPAMTQHLSAIAKKEKISIQTDALQLISDHARGSFRDALTILDQLRSHGGDINVFEIEALLGLAPHAAIENLLDTFMSGSANQVFEALGALLNQGVSSQNAAKALSKLARDRILAQPVLIPNLLPLIEKLLDIEGSLDARLRLEAAIASSLPLTSTSTVPPTPADPVDIAKSEKSVPENETSPDIKQPAKAAQTEIDTTLTESNPEIEKKAPLDWPRLLAASKTQSEPLYALLRMAHAELDSQGKRLTLRFRFAFHAKRLETANHQALFQDLLANHLEAKPEIVIVHDPAVEAEPANKTLATVADILDGEIIEIEETELANG